MRPDHRIIINKFTERCRKNSAYSWRAFARDLKLSPSTLSDWLHGHHELSHRSIHKIINQLHLSDKEARAIVETQLSNMLIKRKKSQLGVQQG